MTNTAGGLIQSDQRAITVDDSNLGNAFGAIVIDNAGTITGQDGEAIKITSILANTLTNRATGVINGSVTMGAGNDTANLFAGQALNGTLNGGAGSDTLTLNGPGTASFAGASAFETLGVLGGNWTLTGAQSYATATSVASGASLAVNGSLSTGTLTFASGSTYNVAVTPAAAAGAVTATGAVTLAGGSVAVTAASGAYANVTQYTLISGASLTGTFTGGATVNLPFLVPSLVYSNTAVQLVLTRNLTFLTQKAVTPNQIAVATALDHSPTNSALFVALVPLSGAAADAAFDALSGEIHADAANALLGDIGNVQGAVLDRLVQDPVEEPGAFWVHGVGSWRDLDGTGGTSGLHAQNAGFVAGYDGAVADGVRMGAALGYSDTAFKVSALDSRGHADGLDFALYAEGDIADHVRLRGSAGVTHYFAIQTERMVAVPSVQTLDASYHGDAVYGFAEASYRVAFDALTVEPLVDVNVVGLSTGNFAETGGSAAVSGAGQSQDVVYTTVGARLSGDFDQGEHHLAPHLMVGWRNASGDLRSRIDQVFQSTGAAFSVTGTPLSSNSAVADAGLDAALGQGFTLSGAYNGQFSGRETSNGVSLTLAWNY